MPLSEPHFNRWKIRGLALRQLVGCEDGPIGSMLTAKVHVFRTGPGALGPTSASKFWEQKAEAVTKSDTYKNRSDIAGETIIVEWHACVGTRRCRYCTEYKQKSENGRSPKVFPDRIFFKRPINNITDYGSRKVQNKCPAQANEVATCGARFRPGYLCFCGPGSEQAWKNTGSRPTSRVANVEWNKLASHDDERIYHQQTSCVQTSFKHVCWHQRQGNLECISKRAAQQSHSRERGVGEQNQEDLPLLAHLQELYQYVKEFGLILSQELIRISLTQCQRDWLLFFVMVNYPEKKIRRLNSGN